MANSKYSVEERAQALAVLQANGGNLKKTARDTGIPRKTLSNWRNGVNNDTEQVLQELPAKCEDLAAKLDGIAGKIAQVTEMKLNDLAQGIGLDKVNIKDLSLAQSNTIQSKNLLRGQATSITESRSDTKRYEAMITKMIEDAIKKGITVERDEAIEMLEVHLPDIRQYVN